MMDAMAQSLVLAQQVVEVRPVNYWGIFAAMLVVFVVPMILGWAIARALKLKDVSTRIAVVMFALILGLMPFGLQIVRGNSWKDALSWGIDLAGGTNLVYQIDTEQAKADGKVVNQELIDQMVGAIGRRLDPAAQEQITVRGVGSDQIEVIIPEADPEKVARKKRDMTQLGKLEFSILANTRKYPDIVKRAQKECK